MRAVFVGAGATTLATARMLLQGGHEVVLIEKDKERIEAIEHELDCGLLHGDGSRPALLREADPEGSDLLFCLTGDDQANILASLVGRTLGFKRVVCKIQDSELIHLCVELGLEDVIVPAQAIGRHLAEMFEGHDPWDISAKIRGDARMFSFVVREGDEGRLRDLELPRDARVVCIYRADKFELPQDDTRVATGDEVVVVTGSASLHRLAERWGAQVSRSE
jgi:trk system potassium uptake protein TrkA